MSIVSALSTDEIFQAALEASARSTANANANANNNDATAAAVTPNRRNGNLRARAETAPVVPSTGMHHDGNRDMNNVKNEGLGVFGQNHSQDQSTDVSVDGAPGGEEMDLELGQSTIKVDSRRSTMGGVESSGRSRNFFPNTLKSDTKIDNNRLPRLVLRDRAFHQSSNKVHIQHNQGARIFKLLKHNLFFVFLRMPTWKSLTALFSVWTGAIILFAFLYILFDNRNGASQCGLGIGDEPIHFAGAFAFSLETCTTVGTYVDVHSGRVGLQVAGGSYSYHIAYYIDFSNTNKRAAGYGLPNGVNSFFERGCGGLQFLIYIQMAWSMIFNAFLLTFLYNRLGRSETRGSQVIYSEKALVSMVDGQVRFQVRLFDCDARHPVVEAHVRFYCVMKHRPVPRPLRLLQPDDELGGVLFLSFPSVVNHNIDFYSLLHPPSATVSLKPNGLVLRQVDGTTGNRDDIICPVCGESYGTFDRWLCHATYQQIVEAKDEYPLQGTHRALDLSEFDNQPGTTPTTDLTVLEEYFKDNVSEILCLVEGIDPLQSGTFQALQSYRYEDIVWEPHSQFAPCLTVVGQQTSREKIFSVDLDRYHDIVSDPDAEAAAKEAAALKKAEEAHAARVSYPTPGAAKSPAPRKRHRRIKTLSNRTADGLFTVTSDPNQAVTTSPKAPEHSVSLPLQGKIQTL